MPLAFILVAMISLFYGSIHMRNVEETERITVQSEAAAVAGNIIAYRGVVSDYARFTNAAGQIVNYNRYMAFVGDAQDFINQTPASNRPDHRDWFVPMEGVKGYIDQGKLYVYYEVPADGRGPSQAGVQAALLRITQNSKRVGKAVN